MQRTFLAFLWAAFLFFKKKSLERGLSLFWISCIGWVPQNPLKWLTFHQPDRVEDPKGGVSSGVRSVIGDRRTSSSARDRFFLPSFRGSAASALLFSLQSAVAREKERESARILSLWGPMEQGGADHCSNVSTDRFGKREREETGGHDSGDQWKAEEISRYCRYLSVNSQ